MFQASLSCSRLLLHTGGGLVMEMLQYGRTLMAIATLMYAPVPLGEVRLCLHPLHVLHYPNPPCACISHPSCLNSLLEHIPPPT